MVKRIDSEPDYYAVLGVEPDATPAEIERAYRREGAKRQRAFLRQGRAAREMALINAAYGVLGYAERRADYDRRRADRAREPAAEEELNGAGPVEPEPSLLSYRPNSSRRLPQVSIGRTPGASPAEAIIMVLVVLLALFVGSSFLTQSRVSLSFIQEAGESLGITPRRRTNPTTSPIPVAVASNSAQPTPAATPTAGQPLGALPKDVSGQLFAGSQASVSNSEPPRGSTIAVTLRLVRQGQPVPNANVFLVAHYRTVDERQPSGTATVKTDEQGVATIRFNVGDATAGHKVNVDVTALVEGQQVVFQTSFTPQ